MSLNFSKVQLLLQLCSISHVVCLCLFLFMQQINGLHPFSLLPECCLVLLLLFSFCFLSFFVFLIGRLSQTHTHTTHTHIYQIVGNFTTDRRMGRKALAHAHTSRCLDFCTTSSLETGVCGAKNHEAQWSAPHHSFPNRTIDILGIPQDLFLTHWHAHRHAYTFLGLIRGPTVNNFGHGPVSDEMLTQDKSKECLLRCL